MSVQFHYYQVNSPKRRSTKCVTYLCLLTSQELKCEHVWQHMMGLCKFHFLGWHVCRAISVLPVFDVAYIFSGQKSCRTKVPEFFDFSSRILPRISSEFFPNFSRIFRASLRGKRRPEKIHQKSPPLFNAKFPGKFEEKIRKMFLESGHCLHILIFFGVGIGSQCPLRDLVSR